MKWNIYSKLWMIFFALMGAACTNQVEDAIPVSGQPIEFSVQSDWKEIPNTRLNDDGTQFTQGDMIQIFGFHKSLSGEVKKFMYREGEPNRGQIVTFDGTSWKYSPKRFWPKEGNLEFYASYPHNSVLNNEGAHEMIYEQTDNSMKQDLLWGISNENNCASDDRKKNVEITMKHALAKVNIILDKSLGDDIGSVIIVSAYKAGHFSATYTDGIPIWEFNDDDKKDTAATFYKYKDQIKNNSVTVFILPEKITGLQVWNGKGDIKIADASKEIQEKTFLAGKAYKLTIRRAQKNTNSRSIAMSVRCVSE